jgi:hypothetical protein
VSLLDHPIPVRSRKRRHDPVWVAQLGERGKWPGDRFLCPADNARRALRTRTKELFADRYTVEGGHAD